MSARWSSIKASNGCVNHNPIANADNQTRCCRSSSPHDSDSQPDTVVYPHNLWQNRVTPEQVTAMRESCQWFTPGATH